MFFPLYLIYINMILKIRDIHHNVSISMKMIRDSDTSKIHNNLWLDFNKIDIVINT